jgi:hypothetical protein
MVHNATFNNISVISWQSVLMVGENGVPEEKPPRGVLWMEWPYKRETTVLLLGDQLITSNDLV